jgi:hypothetical protein
VEIILKPGEIFKFIFPISCKGMSFLQNRLWRMGYGRQEIQGWRKFRRALRKEDQEVFDHLFEKARLHAEAGGNAQRPWSFETILISMLLEQEKELVGLKSKLEGREKQGGKER